MHAEQSMSRGNTCHEACVQRLRMQASPAGDPLFCSRLAVRALVASKVAAVLLRSNLQPQLVSHVQSLAQQSAEVQRSACNHPTSHVLFLQA